MIENHVRGHVASRACEGAAGREAPMTPTPLAIPRAGGRARGLGKSPRALPPRGVPLHARSEFGAARSHEPGQGVQGSDHTRSAGHRALGLGGLR